MRCPRDALRIPRERGVVRPSFFDTNRIIFRRA
jgi:hypothetical protein